MMCHQWLRDIRFSCYQVWRNLGGEPDGDKQLFHRGDKESGKACFLKTGSTPVKQKRRQMLSQFLNLRNVNKINGFVIINWICS